jgi:trimeric autotransporter adhesin
MKNLGRWLVAYVPIVLVACGGDHYDYPGYSGPPPGTYANLQIVAASADAPPIDVILDGQPFITHLDYGQGTGEQSISPTSHTLVVQIETPGAPTTIIGPTTLDAAANMDYVLSIVGYVGAMQSPAVSLVTFPHELAVVPAQSARVQVLNSYDGPITVYLTAPGADLGSSTPLGTAPYGGSVGPTEVAAGTWELWIQVPAPVGAVDLGAITLNGGTDLVFSVLPSFTQPDQNVCYGPGCSSPMSAFLVSAFDAFGNDTWVDEDALLRVVYVSPDAPSLVITNGNLATPLVPSGDYEQFSVYYKEAPGVYDLAITPASDVSAVLASQTVNLRAGASYSLYALGPFAQIVPFVTRDNNRGYATQARLRFIQGSSSAQVVDVYLTASGSGIASAMPTYSAMPFATDTGFVSYVQGSYDLTVTEAGTKTPIIGPISVTLNNSGLYTAVARDAPGGGAPYGLLELDDF